MGKMLHIQSNYSHLVDLVLLYHSLQLHHVELPKTEKVAGPILTPALLLFKFITFLLASA